MYSVDCMCFCAGHTKYGYEMILRPFISDANKLYEVHICIHMHMCTFYTPGCGHDNKRREKICTRGNSLAVHSIGGFKVGVGFSLRKCHMCLATKEQLSTKV